MKVLITVLLILCGSAFVYAQTPTTSEEGRKLSVEVVKLYQAKKYDEALPLAKKVISVTEKDLGKNHLSLAAAWRNLAYLYAQLGNKKEAEKSFEKALSIYENNKPLTPKDEKLFAEMIEAVGTYDAVDGNFINAEKRFLQAIELREKMGGKDSPDLANALSKLAEIHQFQTNYEKAEPLLARALELSVKKDNKLDDLGKQIFESRSCLLSKLNRNEENKQMRERFYPIRQTEDNGKNSSPKQINGGVINGKAVSLPKPAYPAEAREKRASGAVSVQVLIDENGNVISACAVSGAKELHRASEWSALNAKFSPTTLQGNPVKVSGIITYNFVP